jgi:hypothetical protein
MDLDIIKAQAHCREALETFDDVIPICSQTCCFSALDPSNPHDWTLGRSISDSLLDLCEELWIYGDTTMEMSIDIIHAKNAGIRIRNATDVFAEAYQL